MAFNWPVFRTRALTAIVFVAVMLTGLLGGYWMFFLLFTFIHFGCWWEYLKLLEKKYNIYYNENLKLGLMVFGFGVMLNIPLVAEQLLNNTTMSYWIMIGGYKIDIHFLVLAVGTLWTLGGTILQKQLSLKSFAMAALGILYVSVSWGFMLDLYKERDVIFQNSGIVFTEKALPILIILSIWINDTMAYIVGSLIGKTPLSKVSPKKTWEGTVGGVILAVVVVGLAASFYFIKSFQLQFFILVGILALIAAITGTFGDLLESKLKRMAGVKDSGSIMPGHGGFLDRFDSLLLATPAVWIWLALMG